MLQEGVGGLGWPSRSALRHATEAGLALVAAALAARLVWALVAPIGPVGQAVATTMSDGRPVPADLAILERFDPFYRGGPTGTTAAPVADASGLRLFGVRSGASAILAGPDGKQAPYRIGEEVAPGVTLAAVGLDHVVLNALGRRTTLNFPQPTPTGPVAMPTTYAAPPAPAAAPLTTAAAALTPRMTDGRVDCFAIQPQGGGEALASAGLQPGDVLLSVNGRGLASADAAGQLSQDLAGAEQAVIQYERDGQVRTATIRTRP